MIRAAVATFSTVLLIAAAVVYLPALGWSNDEPAARERVAAYLRAASGGAEDYGWSLLVDPSDSVFGSQAEYRAAMSEADWSHFDWELTEVADICDDGVCTVILRLPNGWSSVPEALRRDTNSDPGILISTEGASEVGDAMIDVLQRGWFGGIGVVPPADSASA
jgi:hypothetical protein